MLPGVVILYIIINTIITVFNYGLITILVYENREQKYAFLNLTRNRAKRYFVRA